MRGWRGARVGARGTSCGEHAAWMAGSTDGEHAAWDGRLYNRPAACAPHHTASGSAAMGQRGRTYVPLPCRLGARVDAWAW